MDWYGVHSGLVANNETAPGVVSSGALSATKQGNDGILGGERRNTSGLWTRRGIAFDASLSNPIYGRHPNSAAVLPWSLSTCYYIRY